jgi:hypothetical protein
MTWRHAFIAIALWVAFAALLVLGVYVTPVHCAYCPQYPCWASSACGGECVCLQEQSWKPGRCLYISPNNRGTP